MKHKLVSIFTVLVLCFVSYLAKDSGYLLLCLCVIGVIFLGITAYGAYEIRFNYFLKSVIKGDSDDLVLTFDDGPDPIYTPQILDVLKENGIKATFFLIGNRALQYPELVQRIDNEGHEIGNHSFSHSYSLGFFTERRLQEDLKQCSEVLSKLLSREVRFFRPPFGVTNPRYARVITALGIKSIGWTLRSLDTKIKDKELLIKRITSKVKKGDIILLHDTQKVTLEILPLFFEFCQNNGFQFRKLSESTGLPAYRDVQ